MKISALSFGLYVIIDGANPDYLDLAAGALSGGADVIQLRYKSATTKQMIASALGLRQLTQAAVRPLIINDRLDVALAVGADGVHLGPDDMPVNLARRVVGSRAFIIGASARTVEAALAAQAAGAGYLGVGPVFPTSTKSDAYPIIGVSGIKRISEAAAVPVIAIGGITENNVDAPLSAGAAGAAVVSALSSASAAESAALALKGRVRQYHDTCAAASRR